MKRTGGPFTEQSMPRDRHGSPESDQLVHGAVWGIAVLAAAGIWFLGRPLLQEPKAIGTWLAGGGAAGLLANRYRTGSRWLANGVSIACILGGGVLYLHAENAQSLAPRTPAVTPTTALAGPTYTTVAGENGNTLILQLPELVRNLGCKELPPRQVLPNDTVWGLVQTEQGYNDQQTQAVIDAMPALNRGLVAGQTVDIRCP